MSTNIKDFEVGPIGDSGAMSANRDEVKQYAESFRAKLEAITPPEQNRADYEALREKLNRVIERKERVDFIELLLLEKLFLKHLPEPELRRRMWVIRERFRRVAGEETYQKYVESKPPDPDQGTAADLLADAAALLDQMHAFYLLNAVREKQVKDLKKTLLCYALPVLAITLTAPFFFPKFGASLFFLTVAAGILGALTSILRRVQGVSVLAALHDPVMEMTGLEHGKVGITLALFSGALFGTLLYVIFASGLIGNGGLFPEFAEPENPLSTGYSPGTFGYFAFEVEPAGYADFAKVLVWSFVAGFAERFVPDTLDRFVQRTQDSKQGS